MPSLALGLPAEHRQQSGHSAIERDDFGAEAHSETATRLGYSADELQAVTTPIALGEGQIYLLTTFLYANGDVT